MASSARRTLEALLDSKKLGGTLARPEAAPRVVSTGLAALDRVLGGGWRAGAISEIVGARSTGRTAVLLATLAVVTGQGQVAALVDGCDRFDPASAAAAGVDLDRLLWVRGAPLTVEAARPAVIDRAIRQAVRACDLVLRAGGFAVVALDLADVPPRYVRALPPATWLRLAHVNEGRDTVGLLLGDAALGRSAQGVSIHLDSRPIWTGRSAQSRRCAGFDLAFTLRSPDRYSRGTGSPDVAEARRRR